MGAPNAPPLVGAVYLRPKLDRDDLGEYSTSDDCPRHIIRPGDPRESGKIDLETGTISFDPSMMHIPRSSESNLRLENMNINSSRNTPIYNPPNGMQESYYQGNQMVSSNPSTTSISDIVGNGPLTIEKLRQIERYKLKQQLQQRQQLKKSQASKYNKTNVLENLTEQASRANVQPIMIDFPSSYVLPISITKNIDNIHRTDYDNQLRILHDNRNRQPHDFSDVTPKKRGKGDIIWYRGPAIHAEERLLNLGSEYNQLSLNRWMNQNKRQKLEGYEYTVVEESINESEDVDDSDDEENMLPDTFPMGLRPSAAHMAYRLRAFEE